MQIMKLLVEGRVQRVGYRHYIYTKACRSFLKGYVKNLDDGKVEILVIGEGEAIAKMIKHAKKGPTLSWVYNVQVFSVDESIKGEYEDFTIL